MRRMPEGKRFSPGPDPRRNAGRLTKWERRAKKAIQRQETPERVCALVDAMWQAGMEGDSKAAIAYAKIVGLETADKSSMIEAAVKARLNEMLLEAKRRYEALPAAERIPDRPPYDVGDRPDPDAP